MKVCSCTSEWTIAIICMAMFDILLIKMIRCEPWETRCAATNFSSTYLWHPFGTASGALPTVGRRWSVREATRSQCAKPFRVDCWSRSCRRWNPPKIAASHAACCFFVFGWICFEGEVNYILQGDFGRYWRKVCRMFMDYYGLLDMLLDFIGSWSGFMLAFWANQTLQIATPSWQPVQCLPITLPEVKINRVMTGTSITWEVVIKAGFNVIQSLTRPQGNVQGTVFSLKFWRLACCNFAKFCVGLLLADRLLSAGCSVHLVESRADPRAGSLEGRAYALGLGIRAQRAIRSWSSSH